MNKKDSNYKTIYDEQNFHDVNTVNDGNKNNKGDGYVSKLITQKRELCDKYLDSIALVSGMSRRNLNIDKVIKKEIRIKSKKKKNGFLTKVREEIRGAGLVFKERFSDRMEVINSSRINSSRRNDSSRRTDSFQRNDSSRMNELSGRRNNSSGSFLERINSEKSKLGEYSQFGLPNKSLLMSPKIKSKRNKNLNNYQNDSNSMFITKLNENRSFNSSLCSGETTIIKKRNYRRVVSQDDLSSKNSENKFRDFLSSISINQSNIFNRYPLKKSCVDYKLIAKKNIENNRKFLLNFMNELNINEKLAQKVDGLIKEEDIIKQRLKQNILENNKLNEWIGEEYSKPKKDDKVFDYNEEFEKKKKHKIQIGAKKSLQSMSFEEKVMELDKSSNIQSDIIYKYRKNILRENRIQFFGNDIIFSVPVLKKIENLPSINENKSHKQITKILSSTKQHNVYLLNRMKYESLKRERIDEMNIAQCKKRGLPEIDHINVIQIGGFKK